MSEKHISGKKMIYPVDVVLELVFPHVANALDDIYE